ncbi:CopG family transcriptional regulator [Plectonema cf. radiosum LEGE 06105]|uniref:CopG family transcriptional regulator n=1 Tax=Plectonema cf. radiosum LEGE 06105 TaxID=945769 RepID=A0A8J7K7X9_9CYAN|nr:CopG family transcriptional regulator [Plectonema radiosum]MBE9216492.1 CopG family transcriptional regulator [Plectonema cf. radiosum LEGE 06105]
MNKKRKSLDDTLASEFVYGQKAVEPQPVTNEVEEEIEIIEEPEPPPKKTTAKTTKTKKSSIVSKLQQESVKEATVRLTVDLPQSMHRKLSMLAASTGKKKAEIVRLLLDEALEEVDD